MYPSSPNCPCSALKITFGLNEVIFFDKFLSGSLIKTLYPFLINSLATCFPVFKLIAVPWIYHQIILRFFFSFYFKILISFSNTIPVFFSTLVLTNSINLFISSKLALFLFTKKLQCLFEM